MADTQGSSKPRDFRWYGRVALFAVLAILGAYVLLLAVLFIGTVFGLWGD
jgi:hypothetical protein